MSSPMYGAFEVKAYMALIDAVRVPVSAKVYLALVVFARPTQGGKDHAIRAQVSQATLGKLAFGADAPGAEQQAQRALRELADMGLVRVVKRGVRGSPAVYELAPNGVAPSLGARSLAVGAAEETSGAHETRNHRRQEPIEERPNQHALEGPFEKGTSNDQTHDPDQLPDHAHAVYDILPRSPSWAPSWS